MGFRDYYHWTLFDWKNHYSSILKNEWLVKRNVSRSVRMYASLFTRDMRKKMLNSDSQCSYCGTKDSLVIDHIIPVMKGGRNIPENCQVLCSSCNRQKSDKIYLPQFAGQ